VGWHASGVLGNFAGNEGAPRVWDTTGGSQATEETVGMSASIEGGDQRDNLCWKKSLNARLKEGTMPEKVASNELAVAGGERIVGECKDDLGRKW